MKSLLDSDRVTLAPKGSMSALHEENFKRLDKEGALQHLEMLSSMLGNLSIIAELHAIPFFRGHQELKHFCVTLQGFIQGIVAKKELEMVQGQDDIGFDCIIDPSHSGYPLFIRDLQFLSTEQKRAQSELDKLPNDNSLVEDALFSLFRGVLPSDVILLKLKRRLYTLLVNAQSIGQFNFSGTKVKEQDENFAKISMTLEYLDENSNVPKLYMFEFRVSRRMTNNEMWVEQVLQVIRGNMGGVARTELKRLAKLIEAIDGVQVDDIQRLDLGPFCNQYTDNNHGFSQVLRDAEDSIFQFRIYNIQRMGQERKTGLGNWFRSFTSGDWHHGTFSKVIQSPIYAIMHHRLVQRAHMRGIDTREPVKMFGISSKGVVLD